MIIQGDCRDVLPTLEAQSVQCVVTSPPYWGLRDYGVEGQIGLETSPDAYVETLVGVFREVWRVLRDDGVVWLNLGDSYALSWATSRRSQVGAGSLDDGSRNGGQRPNRLSGSLKEKDLVGIPWRVAFALQADGWYLRRDVVWAKGLSFCPSYAGSVMPESVTDRPTSSHEYLFLLAKGQWKSSVVRFSDLPSERVHFGQDLGLGASYSLPATFCIRHATAIFDRAQREDGFGLPPFYAEEWQHGPHEGYSSFVCARPVEDRATAWAARFLSANATAKEFVEQVDSLTVALPNGGDLLVGGVAAGVFPGSPSVAGDRKGTVTVHDSGKVGKFDFRRHELIISRPVGCSYFYDAEAAREVSVHPDDDRKARQRQGDYDSQSSGTGRLRTVINTKGASNYPTRNLRSVWAINPQPFSEAHFATFPMALVEPCVKAGSRKGDLVLDPFAGSGTVGIVAQRFGRRFVGIELNAEYLAMAQAGTEGPLFSGTPAKG